MFVAHAEHAMQAKTEEIVLSKLKTVLHEQPQEPKTKQQRRAEIVRLSRELHTKRKLTAIRDRTGQILTDPTRIATEHQRYSSQVMSPGDKTVEECTEFLQIIPLCPQLKGAAALLLKPLTSNLVLTALEKSKRGSSPGLDGIQQRF